MQSGLAKWQAQVAAVDELRVLQRQETYTQWLLSKLPPHNLAFLSVARRLRKYDWIEAEEQLLTLSMTAANAQDRQTAGALALELEELWDYLGCRMHPTSAFANQAQLLGRFDLWVLIAC